MNPNGAIPAVKAAVRSYRANESAARDLISTIWTISDHNLEGTAGVVNALVDFIEEEDKKKDLLQAWNGFKIEVSRNVTKCSAGLTNVFSDATNSQSLFPRVREPNGRASPVDVFSTQSSLRRRVRPHSPQVKFLTA